MDRVWRLIEISAAHPFEAAVLGFAAFFVVSVIAMLGIARWRANMEYHKQTGLLVGQLPPPEDRRGPNR